MKHECGKIKEINNTKHRQIGISYVEGKWEYEYRLNSCEECVRNGQSQEVGELIIDCKLIINFCPDCGTNLFVENSFTNVSLSINEEKSAAHSCSSLRLYNKGINSLDWVD